MTLTNHSDVSNFNNMKRLFPPDEYPKTIPQGQEDLNSSNITCGRRAFDWAAKTETADVLAGSEVGFRVSWSIGCANATPEYACGESYFVHPGPGQIYLSRAPNDDLESYQGDGDWFKIAYAGPVSNSRWSLPGTSEVSSFLCTLLGRAIRPPQLFNVPLAIREI